MARLFSSLCSRRSPNVSAERTLFFSSILYYISQGSNTGAAVQKFKQAYKKMKLTHAHECKVKTMFQCFFYLKIPFSHTSIFITVLSQTSAKPTAAHFICNKWIRLEKKAPPLHGLNGLEFGSLYQFLIKDAGSICIWKKLSVWNSLNTGLAVLWATGQVRIHAYTHTLATGCYIWSYSLHLDHIILYLDWMWTMLKVLNKEAEFWGGLFPRFLFKH